MKDFCKTNDAQLWKMALRAMDQGGKKIIMIAETVGTKQVHEMPIVKDFKMSIADEEKR